MKLHSHHGRQAVGVHDAAEVEAQRDADRRLAHNRQRARRRIVHVHDVDGPWGNLMALSAVPSFTLEHEARVGVAVAVRGRRVLKLAVVELGLRHRVHRAHRGARERERAEGGQRLDLDARERVAGVCVREAEVARGERVIHVLGNINLAGR